MNKRILIIDDDEKFADDLKFLLNNSFQFFVASESRKGIELFEKENFDLVILDLAMPAFFAEEDEMEGVEVLRIMKSKWEANKKMMIPVIILSRMATPENKRLCFELQAKAFFSKPPRVQDLRKKIDELL